MKILPSSSSFSHISIQMRKSTSAVATYISIYLYSTNYQVIYTFNNNCKYESIVIIHHVINAPDSPRLSINHLKACPVEGNWRRNVMSNSCSRQAQSTKTLVMGAVVLQELMIYIAPIGNREHGIPHLALFGNKRFL